MPYIKQKDRPKFQSVIEESLKHLRKEDKSIPKGEINYLVSTILYRLFDDNPSYSRGSDCHGVCFDIAAEFYRRKLSKLEDNKISENGDI